MINQPFISRGLCVAGITLCLSLAWVGVTRAQPKDAPYALFQSATITGAGNTITASRIPIVIAPGNTIFKNLTIQFDVDPDGNLTIASEYPQIFDAPALQVSTFKAGSYTGPGSVFDGKMPAYVDGPGPTDGGATSWSFSTADGADRCAYPSSATWYAGPMENTPVAARLKRVGVTSTAWSYGVASGPGYQTSCTNPQYIFGSHKWEPGTLIGVSQSGNAITIASFTELGKDYSAPVAQITYRLVP